jgi:hypothetical protein
MMSRNTNGLIWNSVLQFALNCGEKSIMQPPPPKKGGIEHFLKDIPINFMYNNWYCVPYFIRYEHFEIRHDYRFRHARDRMVVGFTTTYVCSSAYHH